MSVPEGDPASAIVTGSDSGIGRATAVALAAGGCDVGITFHSHDAGARSTATGRSEDWQSPWMICPADRVLILTEDEPRSGRRVAVKACGHVAVGIQRDRAVRAAKAPLDHLRVYACL